MSGLMVAATWVAANASLAASAPRPELSHGEQRRAVRIVADCVVKRRARDVAKVILNQVSDAELVKDDEQFFIGRCMPRVLRGRMMVVPGYLLRYALVDALIRADKSFRLIDPAGISPLDHGTVTEDDLRLPPGRPASKTDAAGIDKLRTMAQQKIAVSRYGECVVRAAPGESLALLRTEIASDVERAALTAVYPALGGCIDKGSKVAFTPEVIRGTIALNYYRLSKAALAPAAAGVVK